MVPKTILHILFRREEEKGKSTKRSSAGSLCWNRNKVSVFLGVDNDNHDGDYESFDDRYDLLDEVIDISQDKGQQSTE
jgi:hypothetical protein